MNLSRALRPLNGLLAPGTYRTRVYGCPPQVLIRYMSVDKGRATKDNHLVVFGGNGFVGSAVCRKCVDLGIPVSSVNRSGRPDRSEAWMSEVKWISGDAFEKEGWVDALKGATGVVSCIGAFGNNEFMRRVCGDATINIAKVAQEEGVPNFVFISEALVGSKNMSKLPLRGYFEGKNSAEQEIAKRFPEHGVCLRPGMIYGSRQVGKHKIPLQVVGKPLEVVLNLPLIRSIKEAPYVGNLFVPPIDVNTVATVAVSAALGETRSGVFTVEEMASFGLRK